MPHLSVLFTYFTVPFATFVIIASLEHSTGFAASISFTKEFFRGTLLLVRGTNLAPQMYFTFDEKVTAGREGARRPSHRVGTFLSQMSVT